MAQRISTIEEPSGNPDPEIFRPAMEEAPKEPSKTLDVEDIRRRMFQVLQSLPQGEDRMAGKLVVLEAMNHVDHAAPKDDLSDPGLLDTDNIRQRMLEAFKHQVTQGAPRQQLRDDTTLEGARDRARVLLERASEDGSLVRLLHEARSHALKLKMQQVLGVAALDGRLSEALEASNQTLKARMQQVFAGAVLDGRLAAALEAIPQRPKSTATEVEARAAACACVAAAVQTVLGRRAEAAARTAASACVAAAIQTVLDRRAEAALATAPKEEVCSAVAPAIERPARLRPAALSKRAAGAAVEAFAVTDPQPPAPAVLSPPAPPRTLAPRPPIAAVHLCEEAKLRQRHGFFRRANSAQRREHSRLRGSRSPARKLCE